jgi:hypothetical protein
VLLNVIYKSLEILTKNRYLTNLKYFWINRGFVNSSAGIFIIIT